MTYLPAPYEDAVDDQLGPALAAGLAIAVAGITSWILGSQVGHLVDPLIRVRLDPSRWPPELLVASIGWGVGTVFTVIGALLLLFRRGRGLLGFGALVTLATTVLLQVRWSWGTNVSIAQWPLYWGGLAVLILVLLPATRRWVRRKAAAPDPRQPVLWTGS